MGTTYQFWVIFLVLLIAIIYFDKKYCMLRDVSKVNAHPPYSWARVQLAWWTTIVLSAFVCIFWSTGVAAQLNKSTVILLGISAATTTTARLVDMSDMEKMDYSRHQDSFGKNFLLDILSDQTGVSVHRFQTLIFNIVFGVWFIITVLKGLNAGVDANAIMPVIEDNNLILLGLSSATYVALKITENKTAELKKNVKEETATIRESDGSVG